MGKLAQQLAGNGQVKMYKNGGKVAKVADKDNDVMKGGGKVCMKKKGGKVGK